MRENRKDRIVPLDSVYPVSRVNEERVREYSNMDSSTQPAIETHKGCVIDGAHRWFASLIRGDRTIKAQESTLPDNIKGKWYDEPVSKLN